MMALSKEAHAEFDRQFGITAEHVHYVKHINTDHLARLATGEAPDLFSIMAEAERDKAKKGQTDGQ